MDPDSEPPPPRPLNNFHIATSILPVFLLIGLASVSAFNGKMESHAVETPLEILLFLFAIGWIGSAFFTILEHALFALDPEELENQSLRRDAATKLLVRLRSKIERPWFALLAGMLFSNLLFLYAFVWTVSFFLGPRSFAFQTSLWVAATLAVFLLGQVLPVIFAARYLKRMAPVSAYVVRILAWLLLPLYILPLFALRFGDRFAKVPIEVRRGVLDAEKRLLVLVGAGQVDVALEDEEREMIDHAIGFSEQTAGAIMTPRSKIRSVDLSASQEQILEHMRHTAFSRILVQKDSLDNIQGILHTKQVLLNPQIDFRELIVAPLFVPEDLPLIELIDLMKRERRQLVVVLDEYGSTSGVISMNDLLEVIVGRKDAPESDLGRNAASIGRGRE